jgi:hypothetical protein
MQDGVIPEQENFRKWVPSIRAYYLSSMYRGPVARHTHCCAFGCVASQVNRATYQTKHVTEDCVCQTVSFDLGGKTEPSDWIRAGHTALVVRDPEQGNSLGV